MPDKRYLVTVQIAVLCGASILLIRRGAAERHAPNRLDLPGGAVEPTASGDAPLEMSARRELREEAGIEVDGPYSYLCSAFFMSDAGQPVVNTVFKVVLPKSGSDIPLSAGEDEASAEWWDVAEAMALSELPAWTKRYIEAALR